MTRVKSIAATVVLAAAWAGAAPRCQAHFPWLATDAEGRALLYFSESPAESDYRIPDAVANAKVVARLGGAEPAAVELVAIEEEKFVGRRSEHAAPAGAVLESEISYGIYHGILLDYYACHFLTLGAEAPASGLKLAATPRATADGLELVVRWDGKPLAKASVTMFDAEGVPTEEETDDDGVARFDDAPSAGLIGFLVARTDNDAKGEVEGQKYTSAAAYGTVTVTIDDSSTDDAQAADSAGASSGLARLPEPLASFGAAASDGWLYVYGGHIGEEHAHSRDNLSNHFRRIRLAGGEWEDLPMETPLQGLPLVAHGSKLYRIGGLNFRNAAEADPDMHSVAQFARFDPATNQWTELPPLPEARSSHDAVVIGDALYVVGGWRLNGTPRGTWLETAWAYDFSRPDAEWRGGSAPPFKRRALTVAQWNGQLVAIGGMDDQDKVSRRADVLDISTGQWSELPPLPRSRMAGFGVSAWNLDGQLLASGADGVVHRLADDGSAWETVGQLATGRFFHRLLPGLDSTLLAVGGASPDDGHVATIESFRLGYEGLRPMP